MTLVAVLVAGLLFLVPGQPPHQHRRAKTQRHTDRHGHDAPEFIHTGRQRCPWRGSSKEDFPRLRGTEEPGATNCTGWEVSNHALPRLRSDSAPARTPRRPSWRWLGEHACPCRPRGRGLLHPSGCAPPLRLRPRKGKLTGGRAPQGLAFHPTEERCEPVGKGSGAIQTFPASFLPSSAFAPTVVQ